MVEKLTRRQFLGGAVAGSAALVLPVRGRAADLNGRLLGVTLMNPADPSEERSSVVALDLVTGEVAYHDLQTVDLFERILQETDDKVFKLLGLPLQFDHERPPQPRGAPQLGEHTKEIFGD